MRRLLSAITLMRYDPSWAIDLGSAASWMSVTPRSGSRSGAATLVIAPYAPTPAAPNRVATIVVAYERILIAQPVRQTAAVRWLNFRSAPPPGAG